MCHDDDDAIIDRQLPQPFYHSLLSFSIKRKTERERYWHNHKSFIHYIHPPTDRPAIINFLRLSTYTAHGGEQQQQQYMTMTLDATFYSFLLLSISESFFKKLTKATCTWIYFQLKIWYSQSLGSLSLWGSKKSERKDSSVTVNEHTLQPTLKAVPFVAH